jgi:hypothetical protein
VSETVPDLPIVGGSIRPLVPACPGDLILSEFALVDSAVNPAELTFSVKQAVLHFSFVGVAISELTRSLSVVDLADLSVLLIVNDVSSPVLDDQLSKLRWQKGYFWKWFDIHFQLYF